jgi:act minimal PKS acyl carrier protein
MNTFTLNDLRTIIRASAGDAEVRGPGREIEHTSYAELGYDSLALLEIAARIKQGFAVDVPDDAVAAGSTPATTVTAVNLLLESRAGVGR